MSVKANLGDEIEILGELRDVTDVLVDPTDVFGWTRSPSEVVTEYEYGVSSALTRTSVGLYRFVFSPDAPGMWYAGIYSTGVGKAASDDVSISVKSTRRTAQAGTANCV